MYLTEFVFDRPTLLVKPKEGKERRTILLKQCALCNVSWSKTRRQSRQPIAQPVRQTLSIASYCTCTTLRGRWTVPSPRFRHRLLPTIRPRSTAVNVKPMAILHRLHGTIFEAIRDQVRNGTGLHGTISPRERHCTDWSTSLNRHLHFAGRTDTHILNCFKMNWWDSEEIFVIVVGLFRRFFGEIFA